MQGGRDRPLGRAGGQGPSPQRGRGTCPIPLRFRACAAVVFLEGKKKKKRGVGAQNFVVLISAVCVLCCAGAAA